MDVNSGDALMEAVRDNATMTFWRSVAACVPVLPVMPILEGGWLEKLTPPSEDEYQLVSSTEHFQDNSRLSCQITLNDDMVVKIARQDY